MSTEISGPGAPATISRSGQVSLSRWVNEKLPPLTQLLSAHEVARLTRRHRWMLSALALLGRFPRQERFRGRAIGWHRRNVEQWMLSKSRVAPCTEAPPAPFPAAHTLLTYHTRYRRRSCAGSLANRVRCSRRVRRRRWHGRISAAKPLPEPSRRPAVASATLPLKLEERGEP